MAVLAWRRRAAPLSAMAIKIVNSVRLALIGQKLGRKIFIVIEKEAEVPLVIEESSAWG